MKQGDKKYQIGVLKRKFKMGRADQEPGAFISKMNEAKITKTTMPAAKQNKIAVAGLI